MEGDPNMPKETDKVTRKLRAILSADVKGYSLLMTDDEVHTIQTLKTYRGLMSDLITQHSGRVVDNPGDNMLAEFPSAVDAIEAAVQIQIRLKKENVKFVEDKRLKFRIGINIGDVVQDGERIYGSGVNEAARIEGLADAGGICISRNTYDLIKNKLELETEYLGEHEVKNIEEPVRVYKVLLDTVSPKPLVEERLELPDKPSIAVLPFTNMSGDPSQEYFSDGLTEQIINGLCKVSNLFVIARNSSFAYKGKAVSVKQIAKELGVRYILGGSVQRAGNRVRITAQLIDATTEYHMWSENYDRDLEDLFTLQDEITMKLISVMEVHLTLGEQARLWEGSTTRNIEAFDYLIRGTEYFNKFSAQDNLQAIRYFEESIRLDEEYALAYATLGAAHWSALLLGWSKSPIESIAKIERCAAKALEITNKLDWTHLVIACNYLINRKHEEAIKEAKKALILNPNGADVYATLGFLHYFDGQAEEGIDFLKKAIRLNPIPRSWYYSCLAAAYRTAGKFIETIEVGEKSVKLTPDFIQPYLVLAAAYAELGYNIKATEAVKNILRIDNNYSLDVAAMMIPLRKESDLNKIIAELDKAGLPKHSPK
jgi:adenylate cyclase